MPEIKIRILTEDPDIIQKIKNGSAFFYETNRKNAHLCFNLSNIDRYYMYRKKNDNTPDNGIYLIPGENRIRLCFHYKETTEIIASYDYRIENDNRNNTKGKTHNMKTI